MGIIAPLFAHPAERPAVIVGEMVISYGRLCADIDAAAALFRAKGITSDSKVGIRAGPVMNGQSYASWVAHLAAIRIGATHATMVEAASIAASLQAGVIDAVIGSAESLKKVPISLKQIVFDLDPRRPLAAASAPVANEESGARRLNLTSGTTGKPKFLVWDSAMIERRIAQVGQGAPIGPETLLYPLLHLRTTSGFRYPLAVWHAGGCVLLPEAGSRRARDAEAIDRSNLIVCSPPQLAERLTERPGEWAGRTERTIITLGGRLPSAVRDDALKRACAAITISYGSTETGSVATGDSAAIDRHAGAVGFVREGAEVEVIGADGRPRPAGEPGLIRIRTELMSGGYEHEGAVKGGSHFSEGWFYPGDTGRLFADRLLAIEGRISETFNLGGWKVSAPDLESKLSFLPGVDDLCACVMPLDEGDLLTFAVVCRENADFNAIAGRIKTVLPRGRPFHLVRLKAIPRNEMGKIPRAMIANKLTALYGAKRKNIANA